MDAYDRKLLTSLMGNSRQSYTQLAKHAALSRERVMYRIERLKEQRYINRFVTIIDHSRLGYEQYTIAIELAKLGFQEEQQLVHAVVTHPHFNWVGPSIGRWSLCCDVFARDREDFARVWRSFLEKHEKHIAAYQVLPSRTLHTWFYKRVADKPAIHVAPSKPHDVDEKDKQLLRILADNSRAQYTELSSKTALSANACKYRIKALERAGIIQGYTINVNHDAFGYEYCTVRLAALRNDAELAKRLRAYVEQHPHVWFFYEYHPSGTIDFDVGFIYENTKELREDLAGLRNAASGDFRIEDAFLPVEQLSAHSLPPAVFK